MKIKIDDLVEDCKKRYKEAERHREAKRYDLALAEMEQIEGKMLLIDDYAVFKQELLEIIENKGKQLAEARAKEQESNYEAALEIYEVYNNEADIIRVAAILGEKRQEIGDYLGAVRYYLLSKQPDRAVALEAIAELQNKEYQNAKTLLKGGNLEAALVIFERYHDRGSFNVMLSEMARQFEKEGALSRALEYYIQGKFPEDIERVRSALEEQEKIVEQARRSEAAGNYEVAISLYEKGASFADMRSAAKSYGGILEARRDYSAAVYYYDIAQASTEARRLREKHEIAEYHPLRRSEMSAAEVYEANIDAVVTIVVTGGSGSGFFVERGGWIVTNHHVVEGAMSVKVRLHDQKEYRAKVITSRKVPDFALLKIDLPYHSIVELGQSADIKAGQSVFAIGSPGSGGVVDGPLEGSITSGIVSQPKRVILGNPLIQIDAAINPGNSGGPLFSAEGKVIGINTFGMEGKSVNVGETKLMTETIQNINFAIHIDEIKPIIRSNIN